MCLGEEEEFETFELLRKIEEEEEYWKQMIYRGIKQQMRFVQMKFR